MNQKIILLVDGYNILNAWPELKQMLNHDLEGARERLNDYMYEYAAYYGEEVYVVYDAYTRNNKLENIEILNGVQIVYTKENQTADTFIERKVQELSRDVRLLIKVVTADWVQQRQILGSGGIRLTPWELKDKCVRIRRSIQWRKEKREADQPPSRRYLEILEQIIAENKK